MPNVTFVSFNQLQPIFTTALFNESSMNYTNLLVFLEEPGNYVPAYEYRDTSTIVLMIVAWVLLIAGFTICCCAQCMGVGCFNRKKRANDERSSNFGIDNDRTRNDNMEFCRHYPPELDGEPLPNYTIVSGLPTYDDALEEFRKAGIILTPSHPTIKIIDNDNKDNISDDNISVSSSCDTFGADKSDTAPAQTKKTKSPLDLLKFLQPGSPNGQVIELTPEQLEDLSKKRLSLQINFNNSLRTPATRPRLDLRREVLRSRGVSNIGVEAYPSVHRSRSSSIGSLTAERSLFGRRMQYMEHRGSLV